MKTTVLVMLLLAAAFSLSAVAQQTSADTQSQAGTPTSSSQSNTQSATADSTPDINSDQNMSAHQPLQPEMRQGFWGKMNPFARKKYVQRQLSPIRNRVNELDDLTAENAKAIKDVDARAQEGIRQADAKATMADQHATDAGNRAQQANQTALQASNRLNTVEQVVGNIDQYQPATQTEIRFPTGRTSLGPKAKEAIDDMTASLKDQKGYIIEVQGFSPSGVASSQAMANSVVRYLVEKNEVPVYRIFVMGMGNAKVQTTDGSGKTAHGNRVEISLLKNEVDQLAAVQTSGTMGRNSQSAAYGATGGNSNSQYGSSSRPQQSAPVQPSTNMNPAPASTTPAQQ